MAKAKASARRRTAAENRSRLLDLAAELFAAQGYEPVSVRDLATRLDLTTGVIYSNFRSKGDLLAEVLDRRVREDMERSRSEMPLPEFVRESFIRLSDRTTMRALLVEAAAAARTDDDLRDRLNPVLGALLDRWISDYAEWQRILHVDRGLGMDGLVRSLWSIELGLGVLDAQGALQAKPEGLASFVSTYLSGLERTDGPRNNKTPATPTKRRKTEAIASETLDDRLAPVGALRDSPKAVATQSRLIEAAIELFATRGYKAVTVRDLAWATSMTTGSIYGNFANKAVVLVEAIEARINQDLERLPRDLVESGSPGELVEFNLSTFSSRATLRALMLEGAAAARSDPEVLDRLQQLQVRHLSAWSAGLEQRLADLTGSGRPKTVSDMRTAVTAVWAAELGLGLMEAFELPIPAPNELARTFRDMFAEAGLGGDAGSQRPTKRAAR